MENNEAFIIADSLVKIYKSKDVEVMALQGLDLTINKGEMVAIIGKSGSGKSTFMSMLGGLERPTAGKLFINGEDLYLRNDKQMDAYRSNEVGFVWQMSNKNLMPYLSATENIMLPMTDTNLSPAQKREKAVSLLKKVGLEHKADSRPTQMSGGEQQRVAIAVALANDPILLLADEPTGAVDTKTSLELQELFRELNRELGITIVIVTHDQKLAAKVDRVLMISDGKISTEKVIREELKQALENLENMDPLSSESHEEYSVMDKANRVQLSDDMLQRAGIDSRRVKISFEDDKIIITKANLS